MSGFDSGRRDFLKSIGRLAALGTLLSGTSALVLKHGERTEECTADGVCSRCADLSDCGLPQALSAKRESHRGE
jgi:hypothetical protein